MARNEDLTQLDPGQAFKRTFCQDHDAIRVSFARDHEMAIALSAEENDSVLAVSKSVVVSNTSPVACHQLSRAAVYLVGEGSVSLQVSPLDEGDVWITVATATQASPCSGVVSICARRMRLECAEGVVAHAVGQS